MKFQKLSIKQELNKIIKIPIKNIFSKRQLTLMGIKLQNFPLRSQKPKFMTCLNNSNKTRRKNFQSKQKILLCRLISHHMLISVKLDMTLISITQEHILSQKL